MFRDRVEAGEELAKRLQSYAGRDDVVVLGMPRGGVVLAHAIAHKLGLPLDVVVTRKIGHPHNPEFAVAAIDEKGTLACTEVAVRTLDQGWLKEAAGQEQIEAIRRIEVYRKGKPPPDLKGKTVIVADDGIATGLSMWLALAVIRAQEPKRVVVAVPVAPPEAVLRLQQEANDMIVLESPENFRGAVGAHYERFDQVDDPEVARLLETSMSRS